MSNCSTVFEQWSVLYPMHGYLYFSTLLMILLYVAYPSGI
jgi:hypothetical protein